MKYGENKAGLFIICLYGDGNDNAAKSFNNTNGIKFPTVSGSGGGSGVFNKYFPAVISSTPTYALVDPDKKVVEKNVYPTGNVLLSMLNKYDIQGTGITYEKKQQAGEKGDLSGMSIWQNNREHSVQMIVRDAGMYALRAFSVNGKEIGSIGNTYFGAGTHQILFDFRLYSHSVTLFEVRYKNLKIIKKVIGIR